MKTSPVKACAQAGVDVDFGNTPQARNPIDCPRHHGPEVLGKIGGFGGLFRADFKGMKAPVLVSSVDGVGTKLKVCPCRRPSRHHRSGPRQPLHQRYCGARRATVVFLDYIAAGKLETDVFRQLLERLGQSVQARHTARSSAARPRRCQACTDKANTTLPGRLSEWWTARKCSMVRAFGRATL